MGKFREGERGYSWGKKGAPAGFPQSTMLSQNWLRGQSFPLFYNAFFCRFCVNPPTPARPGAGRRDRTGGRTGPKDRTGQRNEGAPWGAKGSQDWAPGPHPPASRTGPRTGPPGPVPHRPPPHSTNSNTGATPERTRRTGPPEPDQTLPPAGHALFFRSMAMVLWPP